MGPPGIWYVVSVTHPDGETLSYSYYNDPPKLVAITSNTGYMLKYDYAPSGQLSRITALNLAVDYCAPSSTACTYSRTWPSVSISGTPGAFMLTDALNRPTHYSWFEGSPMTMSIVTPESLSTNILFGNSTQYGDLGPDNGRVVSISKGGLTWNYGYDWDKFRPPCGSPDTPGTPTCITLTTVVTAPLGDQLTTKSQLYVGQPKSITDALNRTTSGVVDPMGRVQSVTQPEQNSTEFSYDSRNNYDAYTQHPKPGSTGSISASLNFTFDCGDPVTNPYTCNRPNYYTDPNGGQTDYTYDLYGNLRTVT
jgi:hypothetical protein